MHDKAMAELEAEIEKKEKISNLNCTSTLSLSPCSSGVCLNCDCLSTFCST